MSEPRTYTINDLYEMQEFEPTHELWHLVGFYYDHIKEAGIEDGFILERIEQDRVETRVIKHFDYDGRRFWKLATVWFDSKPVMVIQNAGREGDDHSERFITDWDLHVKMCNYIAAIVQLNTHKNQEVIFDPNEPMERLTRFYDGDLDGHFERYNSWL